MSDEIARQVYQATNHDGATFETLQCQTDLGTVDMVNALKSLILCGYLERRGTKFYTVSPELAVSRVITKHLGKMEQEK